MTLTNMISKSNKSDLKKVQIIDLNLIQDAQQVIYK